MSHQSETETLPEAPHSFVGLYRQTDRVTVPHYKLKAGTLGAFRGQCFVPPP